MRLFRALALLCLALITESALAFPAVFSGYFDDPGNTALVGYDLGAPVFVDDFAIANNVAVHTFSIAAPATVTFDSNGFAAGGADPYFTLFAGTGALATFVTSNYDQAFTIGGDFLIAQSLAAGDYSVAMGVFANMSFAENNPDATPNLADGFTGLGGPSFLGNYYYELVVNTSTPAVVPEPAGMFLLTLAFALAAVRRNRNVARHVATV